MSDNVKIFAEREVVARKTGKASVQTIHFDCIQTPTSVSYYIRDHHDPLQAYKDYVLEISEDEVVDIYAADDFFKERDPIRKITVNFGKDHILKLDKFLTDCEQEGYDVKVEVW